MRVAVIGAGVSGLSAAWALSASADVTLFEKDARLGGHANTTTVDYDGTPIAVDTGFIVYNDLNYPLLTALFDHLSVETIASDMSFAFTQKGGLEWSSNGLGGLFAWKRNAANPAFLGMLAEIVRFSTTARRDLDAGALGDESLEAYLKRRGFGRDFLRNYLLPMGAAIWSTPEEEMLAYPAASFLNFFNNHRLLHAERPLWRTVKGGSRSYVTRLAAAFKGKTIAGDPVTQVHRNTGGGTVRTASGHTEAFDQIIFACHSDEALAVLADADPAERSILEAVRYEPNTAWLHRDPALMPRRKGAWASWNYLRDGKAGEKVCVSYWMNLLQSLPADKPLFVTLNPPTRPRPELTFGQFDYAHPQFNAGALSAQQRIETVQGTRRTWFAGAWLGHGFHEDGLRSGLSVAVRLGAVLPWSTERMDRSLKLVGQATLPVQLPAAAL
jgi:uncharacterized protein